MKKLIPIFLLTVISIFIIGTLYWIRERAENDKNKRIEIVDRRFEYGKGLVSDYKSYKGPSVEMRYVIAGEEYVFDGGWDKNLNGLNVGDSINFRYSVEDPSNIITELEESY